MNSKHLTKSLVVLLATLFTTASMVACSNSVEKIEQSASGAVSFDSANASAEAEAAEEAFAKEKTNHKAGKRSVASVKKSKKSAGEHSESVFVVQVGTFKNEDNAKKITEKLKSAGLPVQQKKIERENGTVLYAVRFEPTPNRAEAEKFVSTVKAATGENSLIMSVGN